MIDTGYLYLKDSKRLFINTCLGCKGNCSFCYLNKIGYNNGKNTIEVKKAEELITEIEDLGIKVDTIITLGCFSECWDDENKSETKKLIEYFLHRGNQIQLATKKEITIEEAKEFQGLIQYLGQLIIYVSSATISRYNELEQGTDSPSKRFNTFEISRILNIPTVLYMKPVLKDITKKDLELYKSVIKKYGIGDVVVGSVFGEENTGKKVPFSEDSSLYYNPNSDEFEIKRKLMEQGNVRVFSRSLEVMNYYRNKVKERE